jgi:hypothetical protein
MVYYDIKSCAGVRWQEKKIKKKKQLSSLLEVPVWSLKHDKSVTNAAIS